MVILLIISENYYNNCMSNYFSKYKSEYYLKNYEYQIALKLENNEWIEVDYDFVNPLSNEEWISLEYEDAKKELGDLFPEEEIIEKVDEQNRARYLDNLKKLARQTSRKIIGWVSDSSLLSLRESDDKDDSRFAALFRYFKDNDYFMTGEDYQNMDAQPLFDDYTYISFSRRGFGFLMALLHDEIGRYAYAGYTESLFFDEKDKRKPHLGLDAELKLNNSIELNDEKYALLQNKLSKVYEDGDNAGIMIILEKSDSVYWPEDPFVLMDSKNNKSSYLLDKLMQINNKKELDKYIEEAKESEYPRYVYDENDLNRDYKYPVLFILLSN